MNKKILAFLVALTLLVGCVIGGTLAWLTATTDPVVNTFTVGDINIDLTETDTVNNAKNYDYIPGDILAKDPVVTVEKNSENAYVFLKVVVANNEVNDLTVIQWAVKNDWKYIVNGVEPATTGVDFTQDGTYYFYQEYTKKTTDTNYQVLNGNTYDTGEVTVNSAITKTQVDTILETNKPSLTFSAAAVQKDNIGSLANAWAARPAGF